MASSRALTTLLLFASAVSPTVLHAQRIAPAGARQRLLVVRTRGTAVPPRETAEIVPSSLAAAEKIALTRGALDPGEDVSTVDNTIRLTPATPTALGKAGMVTHWARDVMTSYGSNIIRMKNTDAVSGVNPSVEVQFVPHMHPTLVDFIITVTGPVGVNIAAMGQGEHRALTKGEHHVVVLVVPSKLGLHWARLRVEAGGPPAVVGVHAIELTTLK